MCTHRHVDGGEHIDAQVIISLRLFKQEVLENCIQQMQGVISHLTPLVSFRNCGWLGSTSLL